MKWEKENLEEIDDMLETLNKVKFLAKDKLKNAQDKLTTITNEMPEYIEMYKKMKGL